MRGKAGGHHVQGPNGIFELVIGRLGGVCWEMKC